MRGGRTECSGWGVGFQHRLKVWRGSFPCCYVGKQQGLEMDVSFDCELQESAKVQGDMGELEMVENQAGCGVVGELQGFDG